MLFAHPAKGFAVGFVDHRIVHGVVFQEQIEQRRIQLQAFFDAQTLHQRTGGAVADHALHRHHVQLLHQHFVVGQQTLHLGRDAGFFQFAHDEMVELVVHHAFAIELLNALTIQC